jgi:hypothetical protein
LYRGAQTSQKMEINIEIDLQTSKITWRKEKITQNEQNKIVHKGPNKTRKKVKSHY